MRHPPTGRPARSAADSPCPAGRNSGYSKLTALPRQQGRSLLTLEARLAAPHEVAQEATPLLSAGFPDTEDSLYEPTAPAAVRAAAALPPQHGVTQRTFGGVVRRPATLVPNEDP